MQAFRIKTLIDVVSHIGHVAVTVLAEPLSVAVVIVTKIDVGAELIIGSTDSGNDIFTSGELIFNGFKYQTNKIIPVHYLLNEYANLERIVPVDIEVDGSQYTDYLQNGHGKNSIVLWLGGGGVGPGSLPEEKGPTYSVQQMQALKNILKTVYETIPGIQVIGAVDTKSGGGSPYFDVNQFTKTNFNKSRIDKDLTEGPYTLDEISGTKG